MDYPSVGPEQAYLKTIGKTIVGTANDEETIDAFYKISRLEGIIPALESSHAIAFAMKLARENPKESILVNLSGRGDKDIDFVVENYPMPEA
ncbi:Tryptophan synthase beta chain [compost metagenome]